MMGDAGGRAGAILEREDAIRARLARTRTIAVLGIKPESQSFQPAYYVPEYLARAGFDVIPVPVYFPELREILGRPVYRALREIPGPVDLVSVFRRSRDVAPHLDDIIAKKPAWVWFQSGIRDDDAAAALARAGIDVVQDRCLMVAHRRWHGALRSDGAGRE